MLVCGKCQKSPVAPACRYIASLAEFTIFSPKRSWKITSFTRLCIVCLLLVGVVGLTSGCFALKEYKLTNPLLFGLEQIASNVYTSEDMGVEQRQSLQIEIRKAKPKLAQVYVDALFYLSERFILSVVIDIWSPKQRWLKTFDDSGISSIFSASSFSSDHGIVKPSPKPFDYVVQQLNLPKESCLVIGDSIRRDLGGSIAAGIDCILVGGSQDERAYGSYSNLLELCNDL